MDKVFGDPGLVTAFQAGHAGVDLFFVISGFIILFVHRVDIGRPGRISVYLRRRFTRVMPLYWVALALTFAMSAAGSGMLPSGGFLLWSASLLPMWREPFLGVAWTLQYEVVFYAVFAVLIMWRLGGVIVLGAWLLAIAPAVGGFPVAGLPGSISGAYGIEFFFGMAAAQLVLRGSVRAPLLLAVAGVFLFGMAVVLESAGRLDGFADPARLAYGVPAALMVTGLAALEQRGRLVVPAWLSSVGGASYSIYLFQFVFIGVVWQAWLRGGLGPLVPHGVLFAVLASSAVGGGLLASRFVEQPLLRAMRRRRGWPTRAPVVVGGEGS